MPEALYELGWLKVLYLGGSEEIREKPYLAYSEEGKKKCNAVRALPPALFTSPPHINHLHLEHNVLTALPAALAVFARPNG